MDSDINEILRLAKEQSKKFSGRISKEYVASYCTNVSAYFELKERLTDEGIEVIETDVEIEPEAAAPSPFDPKMLDVTPARITLDSMCKRIKNEEIDLNPPFQRKAGIWDEERKSRLIESVLIKIPLPTFYIDATNEDNWVVIDGLQRLTAIKEFAVDKTLRLSRLEFLSKELNGFSFDEIGRKYQRQLEETEINICKLIPPTPPEVKYVIFKRLNTGGIKLEDQEIRNALFHGDSTDLLNEMSEIEIFKMLVGSKVNADRMEDREFCLRYITYVLNADAIVSNSTEYLNDVMQKLNADRKKMSPIEKYSANKEIKDAFERDLNKAYSVLDKYAFRKIVGGMKRGPINKYLFQSWLLVLHNLCREDFEKLSSSKDDLLKIFNKFCMSDEYFSVMRSSDKNSTRLRNERIEQIVGSVIQKSI